MNTENESLSEVRMGILSIVLLFTSTENYSYASSKQDSSLAKTINYKVYTDQKKPAEIVGRLTPMHWAALFPSDRRLVQLKTYTRQLRIQNTTGSRRFVEKCILRVTFLCPRY